MPYVVYDSTTFVIDSFRLKQDEADARVAEDSSLSSYAGDVDIPSDAEPGLWQWSSSDNKVVHKLADTDIEKLRASCHLGMDALSEWRRQVDEVEKIYPRAVVDKANDWIAWGFVGFAQVMLSSAWDSNKRTNFARAMAQGASGVTTATEFFESANVVTVRAPTSAVVWASPEDATRWGLENVATNMRAIQSDLGTAPSNADLASGAWISTVQV